ncbi:MAG: hypothetical protein ACI9Y1_002664 [Lentisphaeria bacterium]|jgi:hypothetical protein
MNALDALTGGAEHAPDAVFRLHSNNHESFESSYWKLENYVVVQKDIFSSPLFLSKHLQEVVRNAHEITSGIYEVTGLTL